MDMFSPTRFFRYATRFAAWVTPHVKEWHRRRNLDRIEGERHLAARNYSEAEKHLGLAVELAEKRRVAAPRRFALRLQLAEAQREQRKWSEAETNVRIALEIAGRNGDLRGRALESMADLQIARGDFESARASVQEAAALSSDPAQTARRTGKLARALHHAGNRSGALALYEQGIALHETAFGAEHAETGSYISELGALHRVQGNHAEAQRHLRRALKIQETSLGADSHEATESLAQLASSLEESGDLDGALAEYERVLRRKERHVGGNLDELADLQARVARMYVHWGQRGKARELLTQAIPALSRKPGKRLADALETMAGLEEASGRSQEAARLREQAAGIPLEAPR